MILNLSTLRSELANMLKVKSIANSRRDLWLNMSQEDVAAELDCSHLEKTFSFSSVANQRSYYLGFEFNKVYSLRDTTNDIELDERTEGELESLDPDFSDTGTPYYYSINGMSWVENQPSSASVIKVVSANAGDTSQTVRVHGYDSNNTEVTDEISLNGTSAASGTVSFATITNLSKSDLTDGIITVTSNSDAVTIARIPSFLKAKQYQPINLYSIPDGVNVYQIRGLRRPRPMINTNDYPDFPAAYHELVLIGATIRGHLDRFRPTLAFQVRDKLWRPLVERLKKEQGNKRGKTSPVLQGEPEIITGGRLPTNYGWEI